MILANSFADVFRIAVHFRAIFTWRNPPRSGMCDAHWIIAVTLAVGLFALPSCQRSSTSTADVPGSANDNSSNLKRTSPSSQSEGINRCALLTDDEVQEAIGPHNPGMRDVSQLTGKSVTNNFWGFHTCQWTATTAQKIQGFPAGWFDKIELRVFDKDHASWAQTQAQGEPMKGFVEGALYDRTYGKLWFKCGHGEFCLLTADTAAGEKREGVALHLSELMQKRLQ